jgi:hypothetical protein
VRCQSGVYPCAGVKCLSERRLGSAALETTGWIVGRFDTQFAT